MVKESSIGSLENLKCQPSELPPTLREDRQSFQPEFCSQPQTQRIDYLEDEPSVMMNPGSSVNLKPVVTFENVPLLHKSSWHTFQLVSSSGNVSNCTTTRNSVSQQKMKQFELKLKTYVEQQKAIKTQMRNKIKQLEFENYCLKQQLHQE